MTRRRLLALCLTALAMTLARPPSLVAEVLCAGRRGRLRLRDTCRPRERRLPIAIEQDGRLVVVRGANVQIVDGSGDTDGPTTGLGNLVIGYDGDDDAVPNDRSGSHNLVIGDDHHYGSYGGLVAGRSNTVHAPGASVTGGQFNVVTGVFGAVGGGSENRVDAPRAAVGGGRNNTAGGDWATVAGGRGNHAGGLASSVAGGDGNGAGGTFSTVSGGRENSAGGVAAVVGGGFDRTASGEYDWAAGSLAQDE